MQYTVMVHKHPGGRYEAVAPALPGCKGGGRTREEALRQLKRVLEHWLVEAETTTIEVEFPVSTDGRKLNPWLATAGMFQNDPLLEPMLAEIYATRAAERIGE